MAQLDPNDLEILRRELQRPDLRMYTAVVMASRDLENDDIAGALARLRIDADKLRSHETEVTRLLLATQVSMQGKHND